MSGASSCSHMMRNSRGTPGTAASSTGPTLSQKPGAVPVNSSGAVAPAGNKPACDCWVT